MQVLVQLIILMMGITVGNAFVVRPQQIPSLDQGLVCRRIDGNNRRRVVGALRTSNNLFDDLKSFFGGGKKEEGNQGNGLRGDDDGDDEDNSPAGEYRILTIPVDAIKPGGLRLFLMFYLMGLQNTPEPKSWVANQPSTEDYVIDFWYHDKSAVLTITLEEDRISLTRVGSSPSTAYLMQESIVAQGILDELQTMATEESVEPQHRLVKLYTPDAIELARDALSFG